LLEDTGLQSRPTTGTTDGSGPPRHPPQIHTYVQTAQSSTCLQVQSSLLKASTTNLTGPVATPARLRKCENGRGAWRHNRAVPIPPAPCRRCMSPHAKCRWLLRPPAPPRISCMWQQSWRTAPPELPHGLGVLADASAPAPMHCKGPAQEWPSVAQSCCCFCCCLLPGKDQFPLKPLRHCVPQAPRDIIQQHQFRLCRAVAAYPHTRSAAGCCGHLLRLAPAACGGSPGALLPLKSEMPHGLGVLADASAPVDQDGRAHALQGSFTSSQEWPSVAQNCCCSILQLHAASCASPNAIFL
jgi:hypothetical protein